MARGRVGLFSLALVATCDVSRARSVPSRPSAPQLDFSRARRASGHDGHCPRRSYMWLRGGVASGWDASALGSRLPDAYHSELMASHTTDLVASRDVLIDAAVLEELHEEEAIVRPRLRDLILKRLSRFQLAFNLLAWWTLNVIFNICNKQCLNSWPHPWALACLHLAIGTCCMAPLWIPLPRRAASKQTTEWKSLRTPPNLSWGEVSAVLPVVALLATGHVTSTLAPAYGTVAFSNIIKTAEPLFTCAFSVLLYKRSFPPAVYCALLLVVAGVALVSSSEVNFSSFSLAAGMLSNAAFALYALGAKKLLATRDAQSTYALLTMLSCAMLAPLAIVMEWTGAGASKLAAANLKPAFTGGRLVMLLAFTGFVQYLSNEVAFCTLSMIHPITYALSNTLKRSIVVVASLVFFRQPLSPTGSAGAAMAILGALGYALSTTPGGS